MKKQHAKELEAKKQNLSQKNTSTDKKWQRWLETQLKNETRAGEGGKQGGEGGGEMEEEGKEQWDESEEKFKS